jgi:hypothetical protein
MKYKLKDGIDHSVLKDYGFVRLKTKNNKSGDVCYVKPLASYTTDALIDTYYGICVNATGDRIFYKTKNTGIMGHAPFEGETRPIGFFTKLVIKDLIKAGIAVRCRKKDIRE